MNKRNKVIIALLVLGVLAFGAVEFVIVPQNNAMQAEYASNQNDALTHDIESVMEYKSLYMGDNSNDANLFYHLPLNSVAMKFQIDADEYALTVNYLDTVGNIGEDKVHRDIVYNSIAAMALIDNLEQITYEFSGDTYVFTREKIENFTEKELSLLLDKETWNEKIQSKISDKDFINSFF